MSFFRFTDPARISWYASALDVTLLTCFVIATVYAVAQYRRGRRDYAVLMVTALFYGLILEISGMWWQHSYTQVAVR